MSIYFIRVCLLVALLSSNFLFSQGHLTILSEPDLSVNHKISDQYKLNFGLTTRQIILNENELFFKNRQVDISHFSTFRLGFDDSASLGIMYRNRSLFEDSSNELRFTQQYNFISHLRINRFVHRIRAEQRIFKHITVHRFRYNLALETALNGHFVDVGETYFINSIESLYSISSQFSPELDFRFSSQLGWRLSKSQDLQVGLQYRSEKINQQIEHILFILTKFSISI